MQSDLNCKSALQVDKMALFIFLICLLGVWDLRPNNAPWVSTHNNRMWFLDSFNSGTSNAVYGLPQPHLVMDPNFWTDKSTVLPKLQNFLTLYELASTYNNTVLKCNVKQRLMIILLLLLSGNVQPNPGPEVQCIQTPTDLKLISGLKIIHLNVRSLAPKMDMVKIWFTSTEADIVIISETWLTKSITNEDINVNGYNVYRTDRPKKGGGVAIYVKSRFEASTVMSKSIPKQLELLVLNVKLAKSLSITVVGCYRPPSATKEALSSLKDLLSRINYGELLMVGDFNWDWSSTASEDFKSLCDSINLSQLISQPTRPNTKCPEKSTLIDLILTNAPHKFSSAGVFCNDLSDHCVVAACRDAKIPKCKPRIVIRRNFKKFNEQAYRHDLSLVNWERIGLTPNVELAWSFFKGNFEKIINKHAPMKKFRVKGRDNPWFTRELSDIIHLRNRAWAKARKTDLARDWSTFRQLRNKCTSFIKKAKSEYYLSVTTEHLNNPQKFWKVIKSFSVNKSSHDLPSFVLKNSVPVYDRTEVLNCFNNHFISSGSCSDYKGAASVPHSVNSSMFSGEPFTFVPFTVNQVHKALKTLNHRKPPGPDLIEPFSLKMAADFIAQPLTTLFNLSIETQEIPSIWKSAFVTPHLKGGDPAVLTNYRPISNLCVLSKILESLVCEQLKEFLYSNELLSTLQSGFRKKHSTITAATKVINDILVALDNKQYCAALFIDLSKAFDTVDHIVLKQRLISFGLSDHAVSWLTNYMKNRTQCVRQDGLCSEFLNVHTGVPQGSVLGPLLFVMYINNIDQNVSHTNMHFYADDTIIYCFDPSPTTAVKYLQKAFDTVQHTFLQLKLTVNADKTKLMLFSNSRKTPQGFLTVSTLEGNEIELVHVYKYLGILIDDALSFKPHIENLVRKLKLKLGFLFRNKCCFSFGIKKRLVTATFLSILDYGDLLYMNATAQCLSKIDSVYHAALRFVTNCKASTHHCELYSRVGWSSLSTRRFTHWCIFIYKSLLGLLPSYICSLIKLRTVESYGLRSNDHLSLAVPFARTELGKKAFVFSAPSTWNTLQKRWKLKELIPLNIFKSKLKFEEKVTFNCTCFT
uniref:Reverse transcriptase domain-containing protein n=1 Tax=Oryzias latipes TaxID=8090 RepID=A0A3B3HCE9_ORYLA